MQALLVAVQSGLEVMAAILGAPIAVEDSPWLRASSPPSHCHGIFKQTALHTGLQAPSHHLTAKHIHDSSQVQPAFVGLNVGDVTAQHVKRRCTKSGAADNLCLLSVVTINLHLVLAHIP